MAIRLALLLSLLCAACSSVSPEPVLDAPPDEPQDPDPGPPPVATLAQVYAHSATTLYTVNMENFEVAAVGDFDAEENITDLAVTPDGRIFGVSGESLYLVDETNGTASFVAEVPGELNVALTFLPNGQLLASDASGAVREIAPDTGTVTELGKFGGGWGTAGDLVAVADGRMFAIGRELDGPDDDNALLIVDTNTGAATYIGNLGYGGVYGSAFANGKVYAFTETGDIIEINPNSGTGTLVRSHADISFWGAAVTPLVSVE